MRKVTAKAVVLILAFSSLALAQDFHFYPFTMFDQDMVGSGARARAMGGAFLGVSDDASALTWNPAGLTQIEKTHVAVSGNFSQLGVENNVAFRTGGYADVVSEFVDDKIQLSYASFVSPIRIKGHPFTFAAGYQKGQNIVDEQYNWSLGILRFSTSNLTGFFINNATSNTRFESGVNEFLLGFGTGLYGDLTIGGTVSIYSGSGDYAYGLVMNDTVPYEFGGQIVDSIVGRYESTELDEVDIKGYGLKGSLLYRAEKFALGFVVEAPYELVYYHDLTRADTTFYKSISANGDGVPVANLVTLFRGKTKQEVPMTIGFGGSITPNEKLVLAADFQYRTSSDAKYYVRTEESPETYRDSINLLTLPYSIYYNDTEETSYYTASGDYIEIFNEFDAGYENSYELRLGGEYLLATRFGSIPLRGGFRYSALPYREVTELFRDDFDQVTEDFELGEQVTRSTITLGSGIHWSQIWLDFAVELNTEEQMQSGYYIRDFELVGFENTRKRKNSSLVLNFTGFF